MHYWNDGYDGWWWMVVMMALVLAVAGAVVGALLHSTRSGSPLARCLSRRSRPSRSPPPPLP